MNHHELLLLAYISQIILISIIMPSWVAKRFIDMTVKYPPEVYPKLYPVSLSKIKSSIIIFKYMNAVMAGVAFVFLTVTIFMGATELLGWDTQSMLTVTFFLQVVPFFYLSYAGIKYQQIMRKTNQSQTRSANLKPRFLSSIVPMHFIVLSVLSFIAYVVMVFYVQKNPFPGFVGYWNILFVFLLNAFYFYMVHKTIISRKLDPHQSQEDRVIHISLVAKILVLGAIFANLFLTTNLILSVLDLRHIGDIVQSLYFQLVALMMSQTTTYEPEDYSVYQRGSESSQMSSS